MQLRTLATYRLISADDQPHVLVALVDEKSLNMTYRLTNKEGSVDTEVFGNNCDLPETFQSHCEYTADLISNALENAPFGEIGVKYNKTNSDFDCKVLSRTIKGNTKGINAPHAHLATWESTYGSPLQLGLRVKTTQECEHTDFRNGTYLITSLSFDDFGVNIGINEGDDPNDFKTAYDGFRINEITPA